MRPRLPSRFEAELIGLIALVFFAAAYLRERQKVVARDAVIAARPAIESTEEIQRERRKEAGPRVRRRVYAPPPAPTAACPNPKPVLLEETIEEGPSVTYDMLEKASERKETPPALPAARKRTRYIGLEYAPIQRRAAGRLAFDIGPVELSLRHELRFDRIEPWVGAGYRF